MKDSNKNNLESISLVIAVENALEEGGKNVEELRDIIVRKYGVSYPMTTIQDCIKNDVIAFSPLRIEEEDLQLQYKNNVDNGFIVGKTSSTN